MTTAMGPGPRELTFEERAKWGKCPVCAAEQGESCNRKIGIPLGVNVHGEVLEGGAHLGRLQRAPKRVQLVGVA